MNWKAVVRALGVFFVAISISACKGYDPYPDEWLGEEVAAPSDRVLWEMAMYALEKEGFPLGAGLDPSTWVATTGWKTSLAPFKGDGFRERAHVKFARVATGRFRVDVRVERETNEDVVRPMDLTYAKWEPAPDNHDHAEIVLQRIKSRMGTDLGTPNPPRNPLAKPTGRSGGR